MSDTLDELRKKNEELEKRVTELEKDFAQPGFLICDIEEKLGIDIEPADRGDG